MLNCAHCMSWERCGTKRAAGVLAEFVRFMISSARLNLLFCIKNCSVPAKPAPMCSKLSLEPKTFVICSLYSSCCGTSLRECAYALWQQAHLVQSRGCFVATSVRRYLT